MPLIVWLLIGPVLGVAASKLPRGKRRVLYAAPAVGAMITIVLVAGSPPCEDLLDGPCQQNWVSEGAALGLVLTVPLTLAAIACVVGRAAGRR